MSLESCLIDRGYSKQQAQDLLKRFRSTVIDNDGETSDFIVTAILAEAGWPEPVNGDLQIEDADEDDEDFIDPDDDSFVGDDVE